ncbi:endonuclease domain-containing protein [Pontibacter ruber]|uniref:Endonuclease domain-containing protein n=1 Tax=Pontibacter ruber TaxID=1343895 RepID=A0ABW5D2E5_9BACT|nr:endonuclease domain-containing protein [Pontibacter ruber]
MAPNHGYNKKLQPFVKVLRVTSTKAEVRLWCEVLRNGKQGYPFLRQRPLYNYIANFLCKDLKLIIEVDGYTHNFKTEEDAERDAVLAGYGFTTLRFTDEEVMKDLPNVQRTIEVWITDRQVSIIPLPPSKGDFLDELCNTSQNQT